MSGRHWKRAALTVAGAAFVCVIASRARRGYLNWGANAEEIQEALVGDELLPHADIVATRAISIGATPDHVWPWIAQLGQGRGGFYSYDALENLIGCGIHSAEGIVLAWQSLVVGDDLRLHPEVALHVVAVDRGTSFVLRGGVPMGAMPPPYDFTWAFILQSTVDGSTRLVVRERYAYTRSWSGLLVEPVQLVSFVMTRAMLQGIRTRAERPIDISGI
jgi:hypothetical protein